MRTGSLNRDRNVSRKSAQELWQRKLAFTRIKSSAAPLGSEPRRVALGLALAENFALFPLAAVVDRLHPARGQRGLAPLFTARGLAQATFRHALFGAVLGRLAR